jgi:hypothetical protein
MRLREKVGENTVGMGRGMVILLLWIHIRKKMYYRYSNIFSI